MTRVVVRWEHVGMMFPHIVLVRECVPIPFRTSNGTWRCEIYCKRLH